MFAMYFLDRVIFVILQMTISSGIYKYVVNKRNFLNGQFFLFIVLKNLVWPLKSERARLRCVECTLTPFAISVLHVSPATLYASERVGTFR